jgi:hypothetical protein
VEANSTALRHSGCCYSIASMHVMQRAVAGGVITADVAVLRCCKCCCKLLMRPAALLLSNLHFRVVMSGTVSALKASVFSNEHHAHCTQCLHFKRMSWSYPICGCKHSPVCFLQVSNLNVECRQHADPHLVVLLPVICFRQPSCQRLVCNSYLHLHACF